VQQQDQDMRPDDQQWAALVRELPVLGRLRRDLQGAVGDAQPGAVLALCLLSDQDGLLVGTLAERLHVHVSVASRHVAHLEQLGLVRRERGLQDGRCQPLTVTPTGRVRAAQFRACAQGRLAALLQGWSACDVAALTDLLARLGTNLETSGPPPAVRAAASFSGDDHT
jgi:DNA-binding MarR family transcriptional regulator